MARHEGNILIKSHQEVHFSKYLSRKKYIFQNHSSYCTYFKIFLRKYSFPSICKSSYCEVGGNKGYTILNRDGSVFLSPWWESGCCCHNILYFLHSWWSLQLSVIKINQWVKLPPRRTQKPISTIAVWTIVAKRPLFYLAANKLGIWRRICIGMSRNFRSNDNWR